MPLLQTKQFIILFRPSSPGESLTNTNDYPLCSTSGTFSRASLQSSSRSRKTGPFLYRRIWVLRRYDWEGADHKSRFLKFRPAPSGQRPFVHRSHTTQVLENPGTYYLGFQRQNRSLRTFSWQGVETSPPLGETIFPVVFWPRLFIPSRVSYDARWLSIVVLEAR